MKKLFSRALVFNFSMLMIFSSSSFANSSAETVCEQYEMQFVGKATQITRHSFNQNTKQICSYRIQLVNGHTSAECPFTESEISSVRFNDANCTLSEGSEVRGILVRRGQSYWLEN